MSKIPSTRDHLVYAAIHQTEAAYLTAVKIQNITSIAKIALFGVIIYFSKSELLPVISELIKSTN